MSYVYEIPSNHLSDTISFRQRIARIRLRNVPSRVARMLLNSVEVRIYLLVPATVLQLPSPAIMMNKDRIEDIKLFMPTEPWHSRKEFISSALKRLEEGEHCYTHVEDGILATYGWTIERQTKTYITEVRQWLNLPEDCGVVYEFYSHPRYRGRGFYAACLLQALHDLARVPGTKNIHTAVVATNSSPVFWFERFGAEYQQSLFYRKVLWVEKRWSSKSL